MICICWSIADFLEADINCSAVSGVEKSSRYCSCPQVTAILPILFCIYSSETETESAASKYWPNGRQT